MPTNDPQHIGVLFFQPNLTNGTLKERQGDPSYLHWVERGTKSLLKKNQYHNRIGESIWQRPTYTKEIVVIK